MTFKIYVEYVFLLSAVVFLSNYGACIDLTHSVNGSNASKQSTIPPVNITHSTKSDSHNLPDETPSFHINSTPEVKGPSLEIKNGKSDRQSHNSSISKNYSGSNSSRHSIIHSSMAEETVLKLTDDDYDLTGAERPSYKQLPISKFHPVFSTIAAVICVTIAFVGYILLMCWRRMEMKKYGNRQMLINEDDFGDIQDEDMRHFEASCIQIEV